MSLNDYFQKNIFEPLGIKNINMFPTPEMKNKLVHMHQRDPNGTIRERDHLLRRPLTVEDEDVTKVYNSGGAGCFAKPAEYCGMSSSRKPTLNSRFTTAQTHTITLNTQKSSPPSSTPASPPQPKPASSPTPPSKKCSPTRSPNSPTSAAKASPPRNPTSRTRY